MDLSLIVSIAVVVAAVLLGIMLAYVPLRLALNTISRQLTGTVRELVKRRADRRRVRRSSPERRKAA